jgi:hypothetical protein
MRKPTIWAQTLLAGIAIMYPISAKGYSAVTPLGGLTNSPGPAAQRRITVPAGTRILVRMVDAIDSSRQREGFRFTATLETNLVSQGVVVARRGSPVYGRLIQASSAGRMSGSSGLTLELTDIVINGTAYPLLTSTFEIQGQGSGGNTTRNVVGGAGLGGLIGGLAGGGRGLGIGALAGAAGGTAVSATRRGQQIQIPSESLLEFRLEQPAPLPIAR